jgi:lipopolysaccharide export system permease protein
MTLFISIFILLMQFLWKYIDDLVGKGLEWYIVLELLTYASASLVPMALPLAILLSSIMTFGNMGEHYELVAMKSSGLSLQRIMFPLITLVVFISIGAFYFSNNILPFSNLKFQTLLYDISHQKPAIDIKEGIFYSGIEGFTLRVQKKEENGEVLRNLMIYDHTDKMGNNKLIIADKGTMKLSADGKYMELVLFNGYNYEDQIQNGRIPQGKPHVRNKFDKQILRIDLTGFQLSRSDEDIFKDNYQMLNINQLVEAIENQKQERLNRKITYQDSYKSNFYNYRSLRDSALIRNKKLYESNISMLDSNRVDTINFDNYMATMPLHKQKTLISTALNQSRNTKTYVDLSKEDFEYRIKYINKYLVEWHRKFTLSFACIILFFIGAPLGAIIRKGGLGMPVVVSVIFFLVFHVLSITGEKFVKQGVWEPFWGMWMASFVLLPIGILLTYKSTKDSAVFNLDDYYLAFQKFKQKFFKKKALN